MRLEPTRLAGLVARRSSCRLCSRRLWWWQRRAELRVSVCHQPHGREPIHGSCRGLVEALLALGGPGGFPSLTVGSVQVSLAPSTSSAPSLVGGRS